jgi:gluconolactonase
MADIEIIAEGCGFPEGPVACDDGSVIYGNLRAGDVMRVRPDGSQHVVAHTGGVPSGLAFGPDGALYCCNGGPYTWGDGKTPHTNVPTGTDKSYRGGSIQRIDIATGKVEQLYDSCDGVKLAGPNDLMFDNKGGFWFTDLGKDLGDHELHGGLYYAKADGSRIRRIAYGIALNGVGLSPDGKTVYAAASFARNILAFDAEGPGQMAAGAVGTEGGVAAEQGRGPAAGRVVSSFPNRQFLDSLAIEADGTIAQAVVFEESGIARVNPATGARQHVPSPDFLTTNIAFGGQDMRTAFVTLSSSARIGRLRWPAPGLRLAYNG